MNKSVLRFSMLFVVLGCAQLQLGCSPRDPAVLTKEEKAAQANRFNRSASQRNSGESGASKDVAAYDLMGTSLLLDRQSEIAHWLGLAIDLADGRTLGLQTDCLRINTLDRSDSEWNLVVDYLNCRIRRSSIVTVQGAVRMTMRFDESRKLESIFVRTDPSDSLKLELTKNSVAGAKATITDRFQIRLTRRNEAGTFSLGEGKSWTIVKVRGLVIEMQVKTFGEIQASVENGVVRTQHRLNSFLQYDETNGVRNTFFRLFLAPELDETVVNSEVLSNCPVRTGRARVSFEFRPKESRQNDLVEYNSQETTIRGQREARLAQSGCEISKVGAEVPGNLVVDWGRIFLF